MRDCFLLIFGAVISGGIGILCLLWQRSRQAKDHLIVTISVLEGELWSCECPRSFYIESLPRLQDAVFRTIPLLGESKRKSLTDVWARYRGLAGGLQYVREGSPPDMAFDRFLDSLGVPREKNLREVMQWFYAKMRDCA